MARLAEGGLGPSRDAERAWDEGWQAARQVVDLEGRKVWAHTVFPDGHEGNPYRSDRGAKADG